MTPWKMAMEAAGMAAWEAWHWPASEVSPNPALEAILALPEPPEFRAAREADEEMLREVAICVRTVAEIGELGGNDTSEIRALLARLEKRIQK